MAAYYAHRAIPQVWSGMLNVIINVDKDVKNKKASWQTLYLNIANIIAWTWAGIRAIYEQEGEDMGLLLFKDALRWLIFRGINLSGRQRRKAPMP